MSEHIQVKRVLEGYLPKRLTRRIVLLTGARQTGKTTLSKSAYPELRYINLDAPENRDAFRAMPTSSWGRDVGHAVIDEAQKLPVVFEKVKYAFDAGDISFCVLTGSSQILLLKKIRETLAGRVSLHELWPLMACELFHGDGDGKMPRRSSMSFSRKVPRRHFRRRSRDPPGRSGRRAARRRGTPVAVGRHARTAASARGGALEVAAGL
jgi:predicted AAA+ superfamily ATPase